MEREILHYYTNEASQIVQQWQKKFWLFIETLANPKEIGNIDCMVCSDKKICECEGDELRKVVENCQER